jgi:hypothetical protein
MNLGTHFHSLSAQFKQSLHDKFGIVLDGKVLRFYIVHHMAFLDALVYAFLLFLFLTFIHGLSPQIIDGIFETVQCTNSSHCGNNNMLESLTHDVLDSLSNAWPGYKSCRTVPTDLGHLHYKKSSDRQRLKIVR